MAELTVNLAGTPVPVAMPGDVAGAAAARSAERAEAAAALAEDWAEGTEPGGTGTKSAKEWSEESGTSAGAASGYADDAAAFAGDPLGVSASDGTAVGIGGYPVERSLRAGQTVTRFFAETDAESDIYVTVNGTAILYRTVNGREAFAIEKDLSAGDEITIWLTSGEPTFFWVQIDKGTAA